jgi:Zn finger protein HypA/HybF involved in hydrogenase expression
LRAGLLFYHIRLTCVINKAVARVGRRPAKIGRRRTPPRRAKASAVRLRRRKAVGDGPRKRMSFREGKMRCEKCGSQIAAGAEARHLGRTLCEDCYVDALSPARACDPWAVYTAKSMATHGSPLTGLQERILQIVGETDGIVPETLAKKLDVSIDELQREIATLRHMEKVRARMQADRKVICLW